MVCNFGKGVVELPVRVSLHPDHTPNPHSVESYVIISFIEKKVPLKNPHYEPFFNLVSI